MGQGRHLSAADPACGAVFYIELRPGTTGGGQIIQAFFTRFFLSIHSAGSRARFEQTPNLADGRRTRPGGEFARWFWVF